MTPKIAIGIPCTDYIRAKTLATVVSIVKSDPTVTLILKQGCYVHKNREEIVLEAQKQGATHLFFIDADMCFSAEVLKRLISHDKDIVGGVYHYRRPIQEDVVRFVDDEGKPLLRPTPKELFRCHALGTGCLLIKMSVFDRLPRPWFYLGDKDNQMGEDIWFGKLANEHGIEVWGDPNMAVGHVGEQIF